MARATPRSARVLVVGENANAVALGARTADVGNLVLRQGLTITSIGLAIGLLAAAALSRIMTSIRLAPCDGD